MPSDLEQQKIDHLKKIAKELESIKHFIKEIARIQTGNKDNVSYGSGY